MHPYLALIPPKVSFGRRLKDHDESLTNASTLRVFETVVTRAPFFDEFVVESLQLNFITMVAVLCDAPLLVGKHEQSLAPRYRPIAFPRFATKSACLRRIDPWGLRSPAGASC